MQRRRHGRVRAQGVASHLRIGAAFTPGVSVENLSYGGAFVRTHDLMPPGTPVVLDLVRPGLKKALRLTGRIGSSVGLEEARSRKVVPGMGISFDPYPADIKERLAELLKALAPGGALEGDLPELATQAPVKRREHPEELRKEPPPRAMPAAPAPGQGGVAVPESARLMVQVKGLLMELGDAQARASAFERENEDLRAEVERLRARLDPGLRR